MSFLATVVVVVVEDGCDVILHNPCNWSVDAFVCIVKFGGKKQPSSKRLQDCFHAV